MSLQTQQYLVPQLAASSAAQQVPFSSNQYDSITVSADNLQGAERVDLRVLVNGVLKQVTDIYGTAVNLTAAISAVALEGGPDYVFVKTITTGLCGIFVSPKVT